MANLPSVKNLGKQSNNLKSRWFGLSSDKEFPETHDIQLLLEEVDSFLETLFSKYQVLERVYHKNSVLDLIQEWEGAEERNGLRGEIVTYLGQLEKDRQERHGHELRTVTYIFRKAREYNLPHPFHRTITHSPQLGQPLTSADPETARKIAEMYKLSSVP